MARIPAKPITAIAVLLILVLAGSLRLAHLSTESVDGDELFSRRAATAEPAKAWAMIQKDLVHPPLYYFLLRSTIPGGDESTAVDLRRLSLAAGVTAILAVVLVGYATPELAASALLAALLLAINRTHIFYSQQARSYALYTALVALLLLWRVFADRYGRTLWYWIGGTALMAAIVWTHYVGALFCAACVLPMGFMDYGSGRGWRARALPFGSLLVAALLFLPWLVPEIAVYRQKAGFAENLDWQGLPTLYDLKMIFADYVGVPRLPGATTAAFALMAFLVGCAFWLRPLPARQNSSRLDVRVSMAAMALAPPLLIWLATRRPLQLPIFGERHLLPAVAPALMLMSYGLMRLASLAGRPVYRTALLAGSAIILCAFQIAPVRHDWPGPVRNPYSKIAEDLAKQPDLQAPVYAVWSYGVADPVNFYLKGANRQVYSIPDSPVETWPGRVIVLYRPDVLKEDGLVREALHRYSVITSKYYSAVGSTFGTRLVLLERRPEGQSATAHRTGPSPGELP
ncbi:MAG: hypothetical protein JSU00_23290 [Acidobacteria bacterium]|nr:hypothetical protein [Acidobacteriota bacterium]